MVTWNCLVLGEQPLKQEGQLWAKCLEIMVYLLSPLYQANVVAEDVLTYFSSLFSITEEAF